LTPLRLGDDLEEHDHDDSGPECPTERIEQVVDQSKKLRCRRPLIRYPPTYAAKPTAKPIPRIQ
jgi:hypothetical protein